MSVVRIHLDCSFLGLGSLTVSQPSCFILVDASNINRPTVRGSNPTSESRIRLSRFGQPESIPALVLPSGGMTARHRKGLTAERFSLTTSVTISRFVP
ncbi:hypothetical protein CSKR_111936 [Clonorchis sinensis]|uniref:Uncharacterized protein n=1 Tax=Clonorchis sinensis TaxID=79923 RepID=A0A3R7FD92_CLOSI|nr:hypothetical protein CSKR_111936 [Clonorchis sinensis]